MERVSDANQSDATVKPALGGLLKLVDEVCKAVPGLQVVVTTTTPPPAPLREPPTRILKLSHASDDDLLLKRRIENLLG